jgi:type III restriction enzyme
MRFTLFDFQDPAARLVVKKLRFAHAMAHDGSGPQTVVLGAPTGAGKTVIATAAIEALLVGGGEQPPDPAATFLWVTDQPELNRQTARKMLEASSRLSASRIVDLDGDFAQERLEPGRIYFVNTQKLRSGANLANAADGRPLGFWDVLRATIEDPSVHLYVVVDEAHRGAGQTDDDEVLPIMQRFLLGFQLDDVPPAPVVLGISATPERFEALLQAGARDKQSVRVDPLAVRRSGLIKDRLQIIIPPDAQRTDELGLLREAARQWLRSRADWAAYREQHGGPLVEPILMVQVTDGTSDGRLSTTNLAAAMRTIAEAAGEAVADEAAFAHAFGNRQDETVGGRTLRYLAPAEIDADPQVRVVFFKASLNQGWDCPRAEVMMSFRTHHDATLIAQLVGRMVRTPLARRIEERDELNSVQLFLPHFDERTVEEVRRGLEGFVPADTEVGSAPPVTLVRADGAARLLEALERIPTYVVTRSRTVKHTARAVQLAGLLDQHEVTRDCTAQTQRRLADVLLEARAQRAEDPAFRDAVAEGGVVSVLVRAYDPYGGELGEDDERREVEASGRRADDLLRYAGRVLGGGLHKQYVIARCDGDKTLRTRAKLEAAALASDPPVVAALERAARDLVDELLDAHGAAIDALAAPGRAGFDGFRGRADAPVEQNLRLPQSIEVRAAAKLAPAGHLYVLPGTGDAPVSLRGWEPETLRAACAQDGFVGWLRNVDRRPYSLAVPYEIAGETRAFYPDLLVVRRGRGGKLVVDLLDPHNPDLPDAVPKAKGLAHYAEQHRHRFGRIELIAKIGKELRRIDLKHSKTRKDVYDISGNDALRKLYG